MILSAWAIPDEKQPDPAEIAQMHAAQRDSAAFAPLYERYVERVYAFCLRRSPTPEDAEDLCSQVFLRALRGLHTYRGGLVSAWLFRIARNVIANHYRGRRPIIALDDLEIPADDHTTERIEQADDKRIIAALIATLPEEKQTLLSLSLDSGLTSSEIGEVIGKSPQAVRVEIHRIIKGLRERYFRMVEGQDA